MVVLLGNVKCFENKNMQKWKILEPKENLLKRGNFLWICGQLLNALGKIQTL